MAKHGNKLNPFKVLSISSQTWSLLRQLSLIWSEASSTRSILTNASLICLVTNKVTIFWSKFVAGSIL